MVKQKRKVVNLTHFDVCSEALVIDPTNFEYRSQSKVQSEVEST